MLSDFYISKGHNGYIVHNNQKITEATFKRLEESGELRLKIVNLIFEANKNLRENIQLINETLDNQYKSKPSIQVEMKGQNLYHVYCQLDGEEYVGTAISVQDIETHSVLALRFIELLFEDYAQLKAIINALSELEENMILTYSTK